MTTIIIYDSVYGNCGKIAGAIAAAIPDSQLISVSDAKPEQLAGVRLLVAGSPTHGGRPTPALKEFLKDLPEDILKGVKVAAFDTHMEYTGDSEWLQWVIESFGTAAPRIEKILHKKGGTSAIATPTEGFLVTGKEGPLKAGELERAAAWARTIAV